MVAVAGEVGTLLACLEALGPEKEGEEEGEGASLPGNQLGREGAEDWGSTLCCVHAVGAPTAGHEWPKRQPFDPEGGGAWDWEPVEVAAYQDAT